MGIRVGFRIWGFWGFHIARMRMIIFVICVFELWNIGFWRLHT